MPLKLGLCTMIYLDYATLEDAIERTAKFGYQGIDIWADSPHLDPLSRDKGYRQEIKKQCRDRGLEIVALSVNGELSHAATISPIARTGCERKRSTTIRNV